MIKMQVFGLSAHDTSPAISFPDFFFNFGRNQPRMCLRNCLILGTTDVGLIRQPQDVAKDLSASIVDDLVVNEVEVAF
jgi:hypothetical protein